MAVYVRWKSPLKFLILFSLIASTSQNSRQKREILPDQPRIVTQNGNLVFQTGTGHDITFKAINGGKIKLGEADITDLATSVESNRNDIDQIKNSPTALPSNLVNRVDDLKTRVDNLATTGEVANKLTGLRTDVTSLQSTVNTNRNDIDRIKNAPTTLPSNLASRFDTLKTRVDNLATTGDVANKLTSLRNDVTSLQSTRNDLTSRILAVETSINQPTGNVKSQLTSISSRLDTLEGRISTLESTSSSSSTTGVSALQTRVTTLEEQVRNLQTLLTRRECDSHPCRNGGTCLDLFNGFICRCSSYWTGPTCETDVNECSTLAGTDLGCQNGGTCVNKVNGFECRCPANWHGIRCTESHDDCTGASQTELCGHGTCINIPRVSQGQAKYKCICDDGWTKAAGNPACTVDVDECTQATTSCSRDPLVQCINIPGSFRCGSCPSGFTGNGYTCTDINECLTNNGGCSLAPRVDCINTRGSRRCASCPSGYQGDGVSCSWVGVCGVNNGGCSSVATCRETPGFAGRSCTCPSGYSGNGVGSNGCIQSSPQTGSCANQPCQNGGTCQPSGSGYICQCTTGYTGSNCQADINECNNNPCQNGGRCINSIGSFTCNCTSDYTGPTCQQAQQSCGGTLRGESGSLSFPRTTGTTYPHSVSCAWVIETTSGKVLNLQFGRFDLESHQNCNYDYLQIHDGGSASSHMIGKFCGNTPPNGGSVNSTHNQLYLWFYSDGSVAGQGFSASWTSGDPSCGGRLTTDHGSINSPGYPGNYPHNRDCVWTVAVAPGKKIIFTFATLALEHHPNCSYDYLQIRDGELDTSDLLQTYCSSSNPSPVTTTGPYATVMFHSDRSLSDRGFHITYASIAAGAQCGGQLTEDEGIIISPNYPNAYNHNAQCVWTIRITPGDVVRLTFTNMDLETHSSCRYDYVEVRDGREQTSPVLGKYCGNDVPAVLTSTSNLMWIMFRSDSSQRGSGFRATYTAGCGGTFTDSTGTITSPSYPNSYSHNKECIYIINQPEGYRVSLSFTGFDVEGPNRQGNCNYDYLEMRDGGSADSALLGKFCGAETPADQTTTGNMMWIKFKTDGSVSNTGFQATFTRELASCGGSLTDLTGSLTSPGHPNSYPHGANCTWHITVTPGYVIRLTFHSFSIEENQPNCLFDAVQIYDGSAVNANNSLGRFCGSGLPPILTTSDNVMTVIFQSDNSLAHSGFQASYVALNVSTLCGSTLTDTTGVITSPNYPGNYPHQRECTWTITVPEGNQILLNITDFNMERHSSCNYDYLEIRNGGFATSPLVGKYCGTTVDNIIVSHSNRMWIRFKTDVSRSARGFRLSYDGTATGCGADLTTPSGSFISPNYPMPYAHNSECFWTITVSQGNTILLSFIDFNLETHQLCNYDYVQIREGSSVGEDRGRFCGTSIPTPIQSKTNKLWIKYRTDSSVGGRGFQAFYSTNCNTRLTGHNGVIESPNFPNSYAHQRNCTYIVETTQGNTINATFSHFDLETHSNCSFDYVKVIDGATPSSNVIGTYCGRSIPPSIATTGSQLSLNFITDNSVSGNGFRMEWIFDGCGGDYYTNTGTFTSPNYPNAYPGRRVCVWKITVPTGSSIKLTINPFDLETHTNCNYDVLDVYGGTDDTAPRLAHLCHQQTSPQVLQTTGNTMFVRFKSDNTVAGNGFSASWEAQTGGCGGNYSTPTGTIVSKNYPNNYPDNTDCRWLITVAENRPIAITFEDFDVEGSSNCTYDYVAIYDGPGTTNNQIVRHCGTSLPSPTVYRSSNNQVYVVMRSDGSVSSRGFKASYITGCGGIKNAETDGFITSPNYPQNYNSQANCTWLIQAHHNSDRVTLTFTHLDTESRGSECNHDYVRVLDGNDINSPELGTYCGTSVPAAITSQGSALFVIFITDSSVQKTGFRATYTKSTQSCGGTFTAQGGSFSSPAYPNSYPTNTECVWTIQSSPGNSMLIAFSVFGLESSSSCQNDYLEIRQGSSSGNLIGRYCGSSIPANITSSNGAWIKFRSNSYSTGVGFMGTFNTIYGGQLTGNSGQIASPNYPGQYPHSVDYTWTVTVPVLYRIRVTLTMLDIENPRRGVCFYDYLKILDGGATDSPELVRYCGSTLPTTSVITSSNQMKVVFHTDSSSSGNGFLLSWAATTDIQPGSTTITPSSTQLPGCGGTLYAADAAQSLQSPGYPNGYGNRLNCIWVVNAPVGHRIAVNITNIDLESHGVCSYDSVEFFDGSSISRSSLGSYCGRRPNTNIVYSTTNVLTIRFVTDSSVNKTGFSLNYMTACGGVITTETIGVIKSPGYPGNYPANQNCSWSVRVRNGRTVGVRFNSTFNLPGNDYLMLLNGGNSNSPPLGNGTDRSGNGRYQGNTAPRNLETSSSQLYVNFVSDASTSGSGFSFVFSEVQVTCGGRLTLTNNVRSGYFTSPNYPSNYPHNVDCEWVILVVGNERVQIDFEDSFSIETHARCNYDYVEFRDGGTQNSVLINNQRYCGNTAPGTIRSTGNVMYARFRTDNSVPRVGFKVRYSIATCGGTINGDSGVIKSPNYPSNYDNSANCEWYVRASVGHYITFTFTAFNLESSTNCQNDYLQIRDGINSTAAVLATKCGTSLPSPIDTSDSYAYVKFKTNSGTVASGFSISFQASVEACGGDLTTSSGTFTSPNYPGRYAHSRVCTWKIRVQNGRRVSLRFNSFQLEDSSSCSYDYIQVKNGILVDSPSIGKYCGSQPPEVIESSGNTMTVIFRTDASQSNGGFSASYSSENEASCGGSITTPGNLTSPGYLENGNYTNSLDCQWLLVNPSIFNSSIKVKVNDLALEHSRGTRCIYDVLEIREGNDHTGQLLESFCGNNTIPKPVVSPSSSLWIRFKSDTSIVDRGFDIDFNFTSCGGIITASRGVISSPNFPNDYDHNDACAWKILAPTGTRIRVKFNNMSIEAHSACRYDYVELFNGGNTDSPSIGKFCGETAPEEFRSQSNAIRIVFQTDVSVTHSGFRLEYSFETEGCGGLLHSNSGYFTSPNYPAVYPDNTECVWDINVDVGYTIILNFNSPFEMESSGGCRYDYVQVSDSLSNRTLVPMGKYCNQDPPTNITSSLNRLVVKFSSDSSQHHPGFSANWTVGCGGMFSGESGIIVSPGFPEPYANNLNCLYNIAVDPQKFITLTFDRRNFDIEVDRSSTLCRFDSVAVYAGNDTSGRRLGKWCGKTAPQPVSALGNMVMTFTTDRSVVAAGFRATYRAEACGGVFTSPFGVIRTPTHPSSYHNNANCTWSITVQPNRVISLKFLTFDIEGHSRCRYDYVEVHDGDSLTAPLIGRYCGSRLPGFVRTTNNKMFVNFVTDSSVTKGGFSATYRTTYGTAQGCGGVLNQTSGSLTSVDGDGDGTYENNLDCKWLIIAGDNKVVEFSVSGLDIENNTVCRYDYLAIYDGMTNQDPLIGKYCGNTVPQTITASSNFLFVRFYTDSSVVKAGFNATYTQKPALCGGNLIATNVSQMISSPNYPNPSSRGGRCRWMIDSGDRNKKVRLRFNAINLINDPNCATEYVQFRDYPLGVNGQTIHYCGSTVPTTSYDSKGRTIAVDYTIPSRSRSPGFQLIYQLADCNQNITGGNGQIFSPGFPGRYPTNAHCLIRITAPTGRSLSLYFNQFYIERHSTCRFDYLEVHNGTRENNTTVSKLCGNTIPDPVFVSTNEILLKFVTDSSITHTGYDITYTSTSAGLGCGGKLSGLSGSLTSPGYPGNYSDVQTCQWSIDVPSRRTITLRFATLSVIGVTDCTNNYVAVYNGPNSGSPLFGRYCGETDVAPLTTTSNQAFVKYFSSGSSNAPVFRLTYSS